MIRPGYQAGCFISGLAIFATALSITSRDTPTYAGPPPDFQVPVFQPEEDDDPEEGAATPPFARLTLRQISRIRYLELRAMRMTTERPDAVTVKIPRDVIEEFIEDMKGEPEMDEDRERRNFRKLTPPQKLHFIATYRGPSYADKVEIESDPEVFATFKKSVMPIALRGCATAGCHSSANIEDKEIGFRLFKDPKKTPETTYTNFLVLDQITIGENEDERRVVNRGMPEESLLLTYMLPPKDVKTTLQHPGDVKYRPIFNSRAAAGFKRIENWIKSLKHPPEDYGVNVVSRGGEEDEDEDEPETKPATTRPNDRMSRDR